VTAGLTASDADVLAYASTESKVTIASPQVPVTPHRKADIIIARTTSASNSTGEKSFVIVLLL
jgi:hypothetical protein